MSYAPTASHNSPPSSIQPQPDLIATPGFTPNVIDDSENKVVQPSFKEHPSAKTTVNRPSPDSEYSYEEENASHKETEGQSDIPCAEQKSPQLWSCLKEQLIRPGVAGGLLGIVNVGLLGTLSYQLYTQPNLRTDSRALGGSAAGAFIILAAEGYLAEVYRNTAQGKEEAREGGGVLYKHTKEIVLRPNVFGGLLGILNLGIIGGVSYIVYDNWDQPHWDRRTPTVVTVGLLSLAVCEGVLAEKYRVKEYPKRR